MSKGCLTGVSLFFSTPQDRCSNSYNGNEGYLNAFLILFPVCVESGPHGASAPGTSGPPGMEREMARQGVRVHPLSTPALDHGGSMLSVHLPGQPFLSSYHFISIDPPGLMIFPLIPHRDFNFHHPTSILACVLRGYPNRKGTRVRLNLPHTSNDDPNSRIRIPLVSHDLKGMTGRRPGSLFCWRAPGR